MMGPAPVIMSDHVGMVEFQGVSIVIDSLGVMDFSAYLWQHSLVVIKESSVVIG